MSASLQEANGECGIWMPNVISQQAPIARVLPPSSKTPRHRVLAHPRPLPRPTRQVDVFSTLCRKAAASSPIVKGLSSTGASAHSGGRSPAR
jgi:hypothetical protein